MNTYDDFNNLTNFDNLYTAHRECRKGKRWKDSAASYDLRALESTVFLKEMLESGNYEMSGYNTFQINERGKVREIKSINYKDRVVQKCLTKYIVRPAVEKNFIFDNGASVKGKGTAFALKRLREHLVKHINKHGLDGYVLVCDVSKYYESISHEKINEVYRQFISDEKILEFIDYIHSTPGGTKGVPLGNELSQVDALLMLSKIVSLRDGFEFLGFKIHVTSTGKVIFKLRKDKKTRERRKLRKQKALVESGKMSMQDARESYRAWKAHAMLGNTYYVLQEFDCYFYELFEEYLNDAEKKQYKLLKKRRSQRKRKRRERCQNH